MTRDDNAERDAAALLRAEAEADARWYAEQDARLAAEQRQDARDRWERHGYRKRHALAEEASIEAATERRKGKA